MPMADLPADNERLIDKADHVVFSSEGLRDFAGEGAPEDAAAALRTAGQERSSR